MRPRLAIEFLIVVFAIGLAGWVNLPIPLHGDAALYQLGAQALASGDMLYRDFWDLKQPGIYIFHWLAGSTFGFTETGLHAFELAYMMAFAILQFVVVRRYLIIKWLAPFLPILTVGSYYALSTDLHLTQPAMVLSAPLFCVLALLAAPASRWRWAAAGAAAGIAITFKFAIAPVALGLFLTAWFIDRREQGVTPTHLWLDRVLPALGGALLVTGAVLLWLDRHGALAPFIWLLTAWMPLALEVRGAHPIGRLARSVVWFSITFTPQLLLATLCRHGWRGPSAERLFVLAGAWLVTGAISVLVEPFAGWQFDFLVMLTPLGILAIRGVEGLLLMAGAAFTPRQRLRGAALVLALALVPTGTAWVLKAKSLAKHSSLVSAGDFAFQRAVSPGYEMIWQSTAFLRDSESRRGSIYVFGDPRFHTLSHRSSASSIHGWAWEIQPEVIWRRLESELAAHPPAFIYAEAGYDDMVTTQSPVLRAMLDRDYAVWRTDEDGIWYALRDAAGS